MKPMLTTTGMLAVLVLFGAGPARAGTMDVKIPFPFVVSGKTLPAGQYRVTEDEGVVELQGEKTTHAAAMVLSTPAAGVDPAGHVPALTFNRVENQYRLSDVWESTTSGREIGRS